MKKLTSLLLIILLMVTQSCVVYHNTSVSLDQAHDKGKVKVVTKSGEELKYNNIELEDDVFYVVHKERIKNDVEGYEWVEKRIILKSDSISSVYLKDYKKSKNRTITLVAVSIPGGILLWVGIYILVLTLALN